MPPLSDMLGGLPAGYTPVQPPVLSAPTQPPQFPPAPHPYLRCPLPPVSVTPDSLRQFYKGGEVPQARILTPSPLAGGSGGGSTTTTTVVTGGSSSVSTAAPSAQSTSIITPVLNPNNQYNAIVNIAKAFTVLRVSVNSAARVELYSTKAAQSVDGPRAASFRSVNNPPPAEIQNQVICDLYLDTIDKFSWVPAWSITGVNGDSPQTTSIYATVTNIGTGSNPIAVTIAYVPIET